MNLFVQFLTRFQLVLTLTYQLSHDPFQDRGHTSFRIAQLRLLLLLILLLILLLQQ